MAIPKPSKDDKPLTDIMEVSFHRDPDYGVIAKVVSIQSEKPIPLKQRVEALKRWINYIEGGE